MKKNFKLIFGILMSVFFLYLSMKDVSFSEVWNSLKKIKYYYIIFMILITYLTYVIRTIRWQILLEPLKKTSYSNLFPTVMVSFFLLIILPARLGEFARAYLVGVKEKISKTGAFSTVVIERILDGCVTVLIFIIAVMISTESSGIQLAEFKVKSGILRTVFGLFASVENSAEGEALVKFTLMNFIYYVSFFYGGALLFVVLLKIFGKKMISFINSILFFVPNKIKNVIDETLDSFILGLNSLSSFKSISASVFYSVLLWIIIGINNYVILLSFGIECKFYIAFIILGFMVLGVMIPAAPGFIGTYHWVVMLAFKYYLPEIDANEAASYAWTAWFIGNAFLVIMGFYYFKRENVSIGEINKSA